MSQITIFKNIWDKKPFYTTVEKALERIRTGASRDKVQEVRAALDKEKATALKKHLPAVLFSGKFKADRLNEDLLTHSGLIVLDFDHVDVSEFMAKLQEDPIIYACWLSPGGEGIKALVRVADGARHRQHFAALQERYGSDLDKSGVNEARVCYESWDPHLYHNPHSEVFTRIVEVELVPVKETIQDSRRQFDGLLKWITNKGDAFVTGERNLFIFKLAAACARFGIPEEDTLQMVSTDFLANQNDFSRKEANETIRKAYKSERARFGSAVMERERLVDRTTRSEVQIDPAIYDREVKPKDVIYGASVKSEAVDIYDRGYPYIQGIGVDSIDAIFKGRRSEITLLTGLPNYGKSSFKKWLQLMRAILFSNKTCTFAPEDYPVQKFFFQLTEMILGADCTPTNPFRPKRDEFMAAYDWVCRHFFYVYPEKEAPTPVYIRERWLEMIIKEGVDEVDVDPFNQQKLDWGKFGGARDLYLEQELGEYARFAQRNNVYATIVAHPNKPEKKADGNFPVPSYMDINGGSLWPAKMDNILIYHRPFREMVPDDDTCELYSKKIKNQPMCGVPGFTSFRFNPYKRRFLFDVKGVTIDPIEEALAARGLEFKVKQGRLIA